MEAGLGVERGRMEAGLGVGRFLGKERNDVKVESSLRPALLTAYFHVWARTIVSLSDFGFGKRYIIPLSGLRWHLLLFRVYRLIYSTKLFTTNMYLV